jgi:hypothetical protein
MKPILIAMALLGAAPAIADCPSHNPYDTRCKPSDFLAPIGTVRWFLTNYVDRRATILNCKGSFPPPREWCLAALQADRLSTGSPYGK